MVVQIHVSTIGIVVSVSIITSKDDGIISHLRFVTTAVEGVVIHIVGTIVSFVVNDGVVVTSDLALYQFNSNVAKHYFCKKCGIYTHHNRKSDPNGMGVNLGCIEELDATKYDAIAFDGRKL